MPEDTNAPIGTPLPEDLTADESLAGFKSVEDLAASYKDSVEKAKSLGSFDTIPEEIRNDANIRKYKDVGELAKAHVDAVKLIGRKGVIVPNENSSPEEKDKFYEAIGRPKSAAEYRLTPLQNLHPKLTITPESQQAFKEAAHKIGLSNSQLDALNTWYMENLSQALIRQEETQKGAYDEAITKLRNEWGSEYANNINLAQRLVKKFGGDDALKAFGDLGNNVGVLRFLANIGKKMSEDSIGRGEFNELLGTAQEAQNKLREVNSRLTKMDPNDPDYGKLITERAKLYELAYPAEAA